MLGLPVLHRKRQTLKIKLFTYMCVLAIALLTLFLAGIFLIGGFAHTKQNVADTLNFQMEVFEKEIETYYEGIAVMSIQLSAQTTKIVDTYLAQQQMEFENLNGSEEHIEGLQKALIEPLRHKLWETDCTGAFIMLEAQVNSEIEDAETSRTGLYLQRNSVEISDRRVLLYRGLSAVGKEVDCMPHRKWRLEFCTDLFPNYEEMKKSAKAPLQSCYRLTDVVTLPGTDQSVLLLAIPILSGSGEVYGFCGFEINESYFKQIFAQPSELNRAIFCLSRATMGLSKEEGTLSAGTTDGYYLEPKGIITQKYFGKGLFCYEGNQTAYVGVRKTIQLYPEDESTALSVLMSKQDYDQLERKDNLRIALVILTFLAVAGCLSFFFTKRYLKPIRNSMERIKQKDFENTHNSPTEIRDLFDFLAEQDRINEAALQKAEREKVEAVTTIQQMQERYQEANKQVERLAYSRKNEVDPYDYENFKNGLRNLTAKERMVFEYYIQGKTVKEIIDIMGIQESTVRYHNKNIYSKLGVHSLKQLLRYAAILKQDTSI